MIRLILDLEDARDILRIDGPDNDFIIQQLMEAIPDYLEATTGHRWDTGPINPLARTTAGFILQYWFDGPQGDYADRLKKTIDSLLSTLTAIGRNKENG